MILLLKMFKAHISLVGCIMPVREVAVWSKRISFEELFIRQAASRSPGSKRMIMTGETSRAGQFRLPIISAISSPMIRRRGACSRKNRASGKNPKPYFAAIF